VGFNRRHAPLAIKLREHITMGADPMQILIRVNAGPLADDHWLSDPNDGGGRLLGEGCHFIDLACWLVGAAPAAVHATVRPLDDETVQTAGRFAVSLGFADGSLATVLYTDQGASGVPKEFIEVHCGGRSGALDDFRRLELFDGKSRKQVGGRRQDKGHAAQFRYLRTNLANSESAGSLPDPLDTMEATLAALDAASSGESVLIG
jgi:polar amino acid transport system substrate-binding protein